MQSALNPADLLLQLLFRWVWVVDLFLESRWPENGEVYSERSVSPVGVKRDSSNAFFLFLLYFFNMWVVFSSASRTTTVVCLGGWWQAKHPGDVTRDDEQTVWETRKYMLHMAMWYLTFPFLRRIIYMMEKYFLRIINELIFFCISCSTFKKWNEISNFDL